MTSESQTQENQSIDYIRKYMHRIYMYMVLNNCRYINKVELKLNFFKLVAQTQFF